MARNSKFDYLQSFFHNCQYVSITLAFNDIEKLQGFPMPASALKYGSYWAPARSHSFPRAWIDEGFTLSKQSMSHKTATFARVVPATIQAEKVFTMPAPTYTHNNNSRGIDVEHVIEKVMAYYSDPNNGKNGRFLSWEHCYKAFSAYRNRELDEASVDFLSLHLAFYLASWGMYRGSTFLFQRDYKVHSNAVCEILDEKYRPLWGASCDTLLDPESLTLLFGLSQRLIQIYMEIHREVNGKTSVSDTLITKILLGTLGCTPAYDSYFVKAIRKYKVASGFFDKSSIIALAMLYKTDKERYEELRRDLSIRDVDYPPMKILDMCFWQLGYDEFDNIQDGLESET